MKIKSHLFMKFKRVSDMKKCSKYQSRACKIPVVDLMSIDKIIYKT